ncbi:hypothetical protein A2625_03945 [candidate division WOR-1 bacterium RIFCSPHIGHO2_01_FULL_53_15]|uniref:Uncharacterized protein n=1 Tax=candidate division WOR-1 bacterium RIFCSPHIGHO2_01_FULL_53_15 TaxID=1802564 RepID=A0A1F4Q0B2_UNCSA|nr:MAG: hypothetical protein A2625_03945 [candidate division WOR-1 bacterium RIFCSPHIGHO2_01_FULL_53_15]OGC12922.1 MAG: hypothetical protein A3D23_04980 [candidate division WOR-1 bacterium RIFCSPHIGHO2_02_FULL_53_26]
MNELNIDGTAQLTIGDTTYRTGGNILFEKDEGKYYSAESTVMEKMNKAAQASIVENGMQSLLKKIRG